MMAGTYACKWFTEPQNGIENVAWSPSATKVLTFNQDLRIPTHQDRCCTECLAMYKTTSNRWRIIAISPRSGSGFTKVWSSTSNWKRYACLITIKRRNFSSTTSIHWRASFTTLLAYIFSDKICRSIAQDHCKQKHPCRASE